MAAAGSWTVSGSRRLGALALAFAMAGLLVPHSAWGALPTTSTPSLSLSRTIRTTPFVDTTISVRDGEGTAFVPRDGSLWLVGDNGRSLREIDPYTAALKRTVPRAELEFALQLGGGPVAGSIRTGDLESAAYDVNSDALYVFSGTCCTSAALPTAFRLTRASTGRLAVESYQPLPAGTDFTGAAWSSSTDTVFVGKGGTLRSYDYDTNTTGAGFRIGGVTGILGLDFSENGRDLLVVTGGERLLRVDWSTRRAVSGWNLDLTPFGVRDSRGVEIIPSPADASVDQVYVYDGFDGRPAGDPLRYAVFVFDVTGGTGPDPSGNLITNPGFEVDTLGWDDSGVAQLSRVAGGHGGSFAARLSNDGTSTGNCALTDKPDAVASTTASAYTASMWVRGDSPGATLKLRFREYAGSTRVGVAVSAGLALSTTWQQVTVSITPAAGNRLDLSAFVANAAPGTCFDADDVSLVAG
jgi:hypothetical protein